MKRLPSGLNWIPAFAGMTHRKVLSLAILLALLFGACQWVFSGWYNINSDQLFYSVSLDLFAGQLWQGDWYPRILYGADGGAGSPVFLIYGPLPFYVFSAFYPLMDTLFNQLDHYLFAMTIALLLCVKVHYRWMREYFNARMAAFATFWFALMPFKLINLYIRANIAYFVTLTFLMAALLFTERMLKGKPYAWFGLVFSMAGIILTHVPSMFIVGWVPFLYVLIVQLMRAKALMPGLIKVFMANLSAVALTSFFWLPGYISKHWLALGEATGIGYEFDNDFVWWNASLLFIGIGCIIWAVRRFKSSGEVVAGVSFELLLLTLVCCGVALFMLSPLSIPLWNHVPVMGWIQMPFRFLILFDVWFGLISLIVLQQLRIKKYWIILVWLIVVLFHLKLLIEMVDYQHQNMDVARKKHLIYPVHDVFKTPHTSDEQYEVENRMQQFEDPPIWVGDTTIDHAQRLRTQMDIARRKHVIAPAHDPFRTKQTSKESYHVKHRIKQSLEPGVQTASNAKVNMERRGVHEWQINADITGPEETITIRKYYLPNMALSDMTTEQPIKLTPNEAGFATFVLPQGKYQLTVRYTAIPMQKEANIISLVTLLGLGGLAMLRRKNPGGCL